MLSSLIVLEFSTESQQLTTNVLLYSILIFGSQDVVQVLFNSGAQDLCFTHQAWCSNYPCFLPCRNQGMSEWN